MTRPMHHFAFSSSAFPEDTFDLVSFSGTEGLSSLYRFDILLASGQRDIDFELLMQRPVKLTVQARLGSIERHGIPVAFEQLQTVGETTFYRVEMMPRLARLLWLENSRIFLDKTVQQVVKEVLEGAGLAAGTDFEFRLTRNLETREYVVQYQESDYAFVCRLLEREGIYFFFEHAQGGEKCILVDNRMAHTPQKVAPSLRYAPTSGLDQDQADIVLNEFSAAQRPLPKTVRLKDWNYRTPKVDLQAESLVLDKGFGLFYRYGDNFKTPTEGETLAKLRAEELLCRQRVFTGTSFSPYFTPGCTFRVEDHFRSDFDQEYLTVEVVRQGRQPGPEYAWMTGDDEERHYYRTTVTAIPGQVQFRPECRTPWPSVPGVVSARIDGPSSGQYPDVDDQGRYKIVAAFDRSGRKDGKASPWLRQAQPYGGWNHGMHLPLHKGCEVLLVHVNGDPDRPVILAAVPNPDTPSPVTGKNQTKSRIVTSSGNELHFEDQQGSERVLFNVPNTSTFLRMGAPNDPPPTWKPAPIDPNAKGNEGKNGWKFDTPEWLTIIAGAQLEMYMIGYINTVVGLSQTTNFVTKTDTHFGFIQVLGGKSTKLKLSESEISCVANFFRASKDKITANKTQLTDNLIDTKGQVTELNGQVSALNTSVNQLSGQVCQLSATVQEMTAEKTQLLGMINELSLQRAELIQNNSTLSGQVSETAQSRIGLHTQVSELSTEVTQLNQQATTLAAQTTALAMQCNRTCVNMTHLSAMDLTV